MANANDKLNRSNHGGVRAGAGRPPKALKYAQETDAVDRRIVDALPEIIDAAIDLAKQGNIAAMRFLTERIFGRVRTVDPVSRDTALPYTEEDFASDLAQKQINKAFAKAEPESQPSILDEITAHFRRNDRPTTALDELAATLAPPRKEPSLFAMAR